MENCGLIAGIFLFIIFVIYVRVVGHEDGQFVSTYMGKEILIAHDFFLSSRQQNPQTDVKL